MSDVEGHFGDYHMPDAAPDSEIAIGAFPQPDLADCPVVPLGYFKGSIVFAMEEGEIRTEAAAKIAGMLRTDIFASVRGAVFLVNWQDGEGKLQRDLAAQWLVRQCRQAGLWDPSTPQRSLGVWPADGGGVILHRGDELWRSLPEGGFDKRSVADALRARKARDPIYRLRPPGPMPAAPASRADGAWFRAALEAWRWEAIGDEGLTGADVAAGWTMAAMLGAATRFRGHLLLYALYGSGKTTLISLIHAVMSAVAGEPMDAFTDAGLRSSIAGEARPVIIDEAEGSPATHGPGPVERALEVLRRMATGTGGTRRQGDIGGGSVTQTAVGAVLLAAVNPPKLNSADGTRMVELKLLPLDTPAPPGRKASTDMDLDALVAKAKELAPAFLGRALAGHARYEADVTAIKAALARDGQTPRTADLISMLAAGRRLLMADAPLDADSALDEVKFWQPLMAQREAAEIVQNPGADALAWLMDAPTGQHAGDRVQKVGDLIRRWVKQDRGYEEVLLGMGLRLFEGSEGCTSPGPGHWLMVANHHPALARIFERTPWGDWRRTLAYLDAMGPAYQTKPMPKKRFGPGVEQRALAIPLAPWIGKTAPAYGSVPSGVPTGVPSQEDDPYG